MRGKTLENVVSLSKLMLSQVVKEGHVCVDATTGNGHDTLFLSELVGKNGFVYGFDIQKMAVESTLNLLESSPYKNYNIIESGHEYMGSYITQPLDFVMFNLGYLPGADKNIKTNETSTLEAIQIAMNRLKIFGILWIVVYPGHTEGLAEAVALESYFKTLNQKSYSVMKLEFINQINNPPYVLALEKKID